MMRYYAYAGAVLTMIQSGDRVTVRHLCTLVSIRTVHVVQFVHVYTTKKLSGFIVRSVD